MMKTDYNTRRNQLLTLTDRKTCFELIQLITDKTSKSVNRKIKKLARTYHFKSITTANGSEFMRLDKVLNYPIYYAQPYPPFGKGSDKNSNRMIRNWLPKGTKTTTAQAVITIEN